MDATKLLEEQHEDIEELFDQYEDSEDVEEKRALFLQIADQFAAHTTIEEQTFYPMAYVGELQGQLREAVEEHLSCKRIIADLLAMDITDENFDAKVKVLQEQVDHHVDEEEDELFPQVRRTWSKEDLETLGLQMEQDFQELLQTEPRESIPGEIGEAPRLS